MKKKKRLLNIITTFAVFSIGASLLINFNTTPTRVEAAQHSGNFDLYTYSGSYYDSIDFSASEGLNGQLRQDLTTLIYPKGWYTYSGSGSDTLSDILQSADEDPTNSSNMIYLYTRDSVKKNAASTWNREHVWPQSLSNDCWGKTKAGTDILHIRPTYNSTNSSRSNDKYVDVNKANPRTYNGMTFGYGSGTNFEPLDSVKGDVARSVMYIWTAYKNSYSNLPEITNVFESYDTLLKWHTADKPDVLEGNRNDVCQTSKQKNRNPFVDHPELAWKIFGDSASSSVKSACMTAYPSTSNSGDPIDPTGITLNKSSAGLTVGKTLQLSATLQPSGATGTISWSSNNTSAATVSSSGLVTAKGVGSATITATVGSYSSTCAISVSEAVNIYGTQDSPLNIYEAKEIIDINGTSATDEPLYVRGIVSSNSAINTTYGNYDYVWLQSDDGETAQAFELYHVGLDSSITDDYSASNSLVGKEVVAYGYGKLYSSTYELATNSSLYPSILSVNSPSATGIELNKYNAEITIGGTITLNATLVPNSAVSTYTWESSDESVTTVVNGVVTGVSAGTATITVRVSNDIEAECIVTVSANSGSTSSTLEIATSIVVGDVVYLSSNSASMQYSGPTSSGTIYGIGASFEGEPNTSVCALMVELGSSSNTYAFKIKEGTNANKYLAWSSGNSLKVSDSIDSNSSWTVSIDEDGNATITNAAQTTRVIWWNVSNPRFACYENKTNGSSYYYVQFWKLNASNLQSPSPNDYLSSASSFATIHGTENVTEGSQTAISKTIAEVSGTTTNGTQVASLTLDSVITVSVNADGNNGKVYNGGAEWRLYQTNSAVVTVAAGTGYVISSITFTFTVDKTGILKFNNSTITSGSPVTVSGNSVQFEVGNSGSATNGQVKITAIEVTYGQSGSVSIDGVVMRFGARFAKDTWDNMATNYTIKDYGVMLFKRLTNTSEPTLTVEEAYNGGRTLATVRKGSGDAPYLDTDTNEYVFNAKVNISSSNYGLVIVAAPFVVIEDSNGDDQYYFLDQLEYSAKTLAQHYVGDSTYQYLSQSALNYLANA